MTRQPFLDFKQRVVPRGWVGDTEEGGGGQFSHRGSEYNAI